MKNSATHLYWHLRRPADLFKVTIGVSLCNRSFPRKHLTNDLDAVTCPTCQDRYRQRASSEEATTMSESKILDAAMKPTPPAPLTGPEMVAKYNELAKARGKPQIKKFRTLEDARRRLSAIMRPEEKTNGAPEKKPPEKKAAAKSVKKHNPRKKNGLDPNAVITILKKDAYDAARKTKCGDNFVKMRSKARITVGEYLSSIGTSGDLRWWENRGFIKIG